MTFTQAPWFHGNLSKHGAEILLCDKSGSYEDGIFLVRDHTQKGQYVLSLNYKGSPTHHLLSLKEGHLAVNGKVYGECSSLEALVELLSCATLPPGWPIRFNGYVDKSGEFHALEWKKSNEEASATAARSEEGDEDHDAPWLHGDIRKAQANKLLQSGGGSKDGQFLVRQGNDATFVLYLIYKGLPTHHQIKLTEKGVLGVNGKSYGIETVKLSDLIYALAAKPPGWPVALTEYVQKSSGKMVAMVLALSHDEYGRHIPFSL